jgi:hypothetical protein
MKARSFFKTLGGYLDWLLASLKKAPSSKDELKTIILEALGRKPTKPQYTRRATNGDRF